MELLGLRGQVSVAELAERFDVSALTIRRDLDSLEAEKLISRSYGVATLINPEPNETSSNQVRSKRSIAREAAKLVEDGDTIFVNTSSTALQIIEFITAQDVTVITNNGRALQMPLSSTMTVILTGGEIRVPKWSMCGEFAIASISRVRAAKCFMGCNGVDVAGGITTMSSQEAPINTLMIQNADKCVVLADHSKIGITSSFRYGTVGQVDTLITDVLSDDGSLEKYLEAGVKHIPIVEIEGFPTERQPRVI